jgi:esterase/lipase
MIQKTVSFIFKITERLTPGLAGKLAVFLFFKPLKKSRKQFEQTKLNRAEKKRIQLQNLPYHHNPFGTYALYSWGQGPAVLLVHGWGGRGSQLEEFIDPLVEAGYQVLAFDAFAHGDSSGKSTNVMEFVSIIQDIEKRTGGFDAMIAHSLGGMAAVLAIKRGVAAQKIITINSPVSVDFIFTAFAAQINASSKSVGYISDFIEKITRMSIDEFSADQFISGSQVQGMIIHDTDDKEVPVDQAYSLHQSWENSTLTLTHRLGHRRILRDSRTISNIMRFLNSRVKQDAVQIPV